MEKNDDQRPLLSKEFLRLLHEDVHLYQHLLTLLGKERECLRTLSVEELCVTAKVKETELLKIKVLEQTLRDMIGEFLTSHNHADKKASLTT